MAVKISYLKRPVLEAYLLDSLTPQVVKEMTVAEMKNYIKNSKEYKEDMEEVLDQLRHIKEELETKEKAREEREDRKAREERDKIREHELKMKELELGLLDIDSVIAYDHEEKNSYSAPLKVEEAIQTEKFEDKCSDYIVVKDCSTALNNIVKDIDIKVGYNIEVNNIVGSIVTDDIVDNNIVENIVTDNLVDKNGVDNVTVIHGNIIVDNVAKGTGNRIIDDNCSIGKNSIMESNVNKNVCDDTENDGFNSYNELGQTKNGQFSSEVKNVTKDFSEEPVDSIVTVKEQNMRLQSVKCGPFASQVEKSVDSVVAVVEQNMCFQNVESVHFVSQVYNTLEGPRRKSVDSGAKNEDDNWEQKMDSQNISCVRSSDALFLEEKETVKSNDLCENGNDDCLKLQATDGFGHKIRYIRCKNKIIGYHTPIT